MIHALAVTESAGAAVGLGVGFTEGAAVGMVALTLVGATDGVLSRS
jgi:hypothetical protein